MTTSTGSTQGWNASARRFARIFTGYVLAAGLAWLSIGAARADATLNPILLVSSCDSGLTGVGRLSQQCFGGFQLDLAILG